MPVSLECKKIRPLKSPGYWIAAQAGAIEGIRRIGTVGGSNGKFQELWRRKLVVIEAQYPGRRDLSGNRGQEGFDARLVAFHFYQWETVFSNEIPRSVRRPSVDGVNSSDFIRLIELKKTS